jgi:hypothetical protein
VGYFLNNLAPNMSDKRKSTTKMKNSTFATEAAPAAMPVNPNSPAINAITKKIKVQRNMIFVLRVYNASLIEIIVPDFNTTLSN